MRRFFRLWRDVRGEVTAVSTLLLCTILGIGSIVGLVVLRNQVVQEFGDVHDALRHLDQTIIINGVVKYDDTVAPGGPPPHNGNNGDIDFPPPPPNVPGEAPGP